MLRHRHFLAIVAVLVAAGAIASCTNDFDQFDPQGANTTSTSATATTTTTGGGSGGSGAAGGGTTSSGPTGEDCLDGMDNDGDGAVDCADADDCGAYECIDRPSDVWEGPGVLYAGPPGMIPDCPAEFPTIAFEGLGDPVQEDASCTACSCSTPTVTCNLANLVSYSNGNCSGSSEQHQQPPVGTCDTINPSGGTDSYRAQAPSASSTACTPSGGVATVPPAQAGTGARVCTAALSDAGCGDADRVCVPIDVGAPFEAKVCVWRSGNQGCPNGFDDKFLFATELDDTRDCSACACGNANATCTATTTLYSDGACTNQLDTVPNTNTCVQEGVVGSIMVATTTMGSCPSNGGQPIGDVGLGQGETTVCCRQ